MQAARGTAAVPSRRTSKQEAANRERGPHGARRDPRRKDGPRAEQPKAQVRGTAAAMKIVLSSRNALTWEC